MSKAHSIIENVANWLKEGTAARVLLKKVLVISAAFLILYRLGYAVGKLLFHISP